MSFSHFNNFSCFESLLRNSDSQLPSYKTKVAGFSLAYFAFLIDIKPKNYETAPDQWPNPHIYKPLLVEDMHFLNFLLAKEKCLHEKPQQILKRVRRLDRRVFFCFSDGACLNKLLFLVVLW